MSRAGREAALANHRRRSAARLEDLEWLLVECGEWPERAARRTGFGNTESAKRFLYRQERTDLISHLNTSEWDPA